MFMINQTESNLHLHRQILAASGSNLNRLSKWEVFLSTLTRLGPVVNAKKKKEDEEEEKYRGLIRDTRPVGSIDDWLKRTET